MKRRIFWSIFITSFIVLIITVAFVMTTVYRDFAAERQSEIKTEMGYIVDAYTEKGLTYLQNLGQESNNRITLIAEDGTVIYDNYSDAAELPNHADRPEIMAAFETGSGENIRVSDTLSADTYYYAVLLSDGTVLRLSATFENIMKMLDASATALFAVMVLALIAAGIIARYLTAGIIKPINELDLDHPFVGKSYDELSPLLMRLEKQQVKINEQVEHLKRRQNEFNEITDNMREAMIIFGTDKKVLTANKSSKELFFSSDLCGKSYADICRDTVFLHAANTAFDGKDAECRLEKNERIYSLSFTPVKSSSGNGCVMLAMDISEKEQSEKLRREFSANVSHELKTPLTSIMGYAELVKEGIAQKEDIPRFAKQIYDEAQRLLTLIEDIIRLSMLDEGNIQEEFKEVELFDLAHKVKNELEAKAKEKGISLRLEGENETVYGIEGTLHEMLFNLCDNAIVYNRTGGHVIISTGKSEEGVFLKVADNGIGIAKADQARVFERFYRVDKSRSRETGGTGLGLSIVKHAVLLHNAKIKLESEPEKGTEITVIFPPKKSDE